MQLPPVRSFHFESSAEPPAWLSQQGERGHETATPSGSSVSACDTNPKREQGPSLALRVGVTAAEICTQKRKSPTSATAELARPKVTRLKPPGDVIKFEDRLQYVSSPRWKPSSTRGHFRFPFGRSLISWKGSHFLYTRHAAILADEMGLGKTMQAITAVRLLLHSGEMRNVLLICPKPLVANWQREFSLWAPEVPVTVIEGDQARRRWQWQLPDMPVKIANYELLNRDRELLECAAAMPGRPWYSIW